MSSIYDLQKLAITVCHSPNVSLSFIYSAFPRWHTRCQSKKCTDDVQVRIKEKL